MPVFLRVYAFIFAGYLGLGLLVPTTYVNGSYIQSFTLMTVFFLISTVTAVCFLGGVGGIQCSERKASGLSQSLAVSPAYLLLLPLLFSCLAMMALFYDRIFIQGIDYSRGVAYAREAWRAAGEQRTGVSSVFSVLGNLFSSFYFVSAALTFLEWEKHRKRLKWSVLLVSLALLMGNSFLLGGRSLLMMAAVTIAALMLIRKSRGQSFAPFRVTVSTRIVSLFLVLSVMVYGVYVFHLRAQQNDITSSQYLDSMSAHLGGRVVEGYGCHETDGLVCNVLNYSSLAGSYITHSAWTFQAAMGLENKPGNVLFNFYRTNVARLAGTRHAQEEWAFSGLFISLPGALYYDYGYIGLVFGALVLGLGLGLVQYWSRRSMGLIRLSFTLGVIYIAFLFPLVPAMDIMSFPFIMIGFGTVWSIRAFGQLLSQTVTKEQARLRHI